MKIYNSLSRTKDEFVPLKDGEVGMYVCGPTVYDEPHIGHARSAYIFDVIRRYLKYKGYRVTFVRNVTDVDDKIIDKARREAAKAGQVSPDLGALSREVSTRYLDSYHRDMDLLGIGRPDSEPKATEYIDKMKAFIKGLIDSGSAYESGGDIYFDIKKARGYGKLSNQNVDKMESGSRVPSGEKKRDALDFALWKKAKELEPSWDSPWGRGRPGWHIECSVMSSDILGDTFDIHGGGIDLIFPHHENEIVQSEGAGKKFARYWIHNGLLTINSEKMAKSLGNFISIQGFIEKHKDPDYMKLLFLGTHYRHPVDYTEEKISSMKSEKKKFEIFMNRSKRALERSGKVDQVFETRSYSLESTYQAYCRVLESAMDDDFDMPGALSVVFKCIREMNRILDKEPLSQDSLSNIAGARGFIKEITETVFGLNPEPILIDDEQILFKINQRNFARDRKDYGESDTIRKDLLNEGIILEDTKDGTIWRRKV